MNQPLEFVTHDLDMMIPGGTPMLTAGPGMYNTTSQGMGGMMPPGFGGPPPPGPYNSYRGF